MATVNDQLLFARAMRLSPGEGGHESGRGCQFSCAFGVFIINGVPVN
jgi:hypothetical protein